MASVCPHLSSVRVPAAGAVIHKEECTQCYHTDASPSGLDVCLTCYNGGCTGLDSFGHAARHATLGVGHPIVLNIRKIEIEKDENAEAQGEEDAEMKDASSAEEPATKKQSTGVEGSSSEADKLKIVDESPKYRYETQARCLVCARELQPEEDASGNLAKCIQTLMASESSTKPKEIDLMTEEVKHDCPHVAALKQVDDPPYIGDRTVFKCEYPTGCDVTIKDDAMWLCLTCGKVGCGRRQIIGPGQWSKGHSHGVAHFDSCGHPCSVKLGTITPEGRGDVYCYKCNDAVMDPDLTRHVNTFGIYIDDPSQVTAKTVNEMAMEWNKKHNWSLVFDEEGREATLAFGPGKTGLANLGNSCYMASVLQVLFSLPSFISHFHTPALDHLSTCGSMKPAECFQCQMSKLSIGLLSGRYDPQPTEAEWKEIERERMEREERRKKEKEDATSPRTDDANESKKRKKPLQSGVAPRMFKTLMAGRHPEFSSGRQQDSFEYFHYLLDFILAKEHARNSANKWDPYTPFYFQQEQRLQCGRCKKVRYTKSRQTEIALPIPLPDPLPPKPEDEKKKEEKEKDASAMDTSSSTGESSSMGGDKQQQQQQKKKKPPPPKEYPPISFNSCLREWSRLTVIEDWTCPSCSTPSTAIHSSRFHTFPDVLLVHMRRFVLQGWVPEKLDIQVLLGEDADKQAEEAQKAAKEGKYTAVAGGSYSSTNASTETPTAGASSSSSSSGPITDTQEQTAHLTLDDLRARGKQANEEELPEAPAGSGESSGSAGPQKVPDASIVSGLESMGFGRNACQRAALAVDNSSPDAAAAWLFQHMEDPDINDPLPQPASGGSSSAAGGADEPSAEAISNLESMGFDSRRAKYALKQCGQNVERAVEWLFSHMDEDIPEEGAQASPQPEKEVEIDTAPAGYELFGFITHLGKSTGSGHYIAHVRKDGKWLQFNDHKVSYVLNPLRAASYAYMLFFRRVSDGNKS